MAKVSVILTTFNRLKFLKKAIQSILVQTFQDFEIIVVDDCSTDRTSKWMKKNKDPRIKYIRTDKNCGFDSKPKNIGVQNATTDYICFLDDDDIYMPDALMTLYNYITASKADLVYADYLIDGKPGWSVNFNIQLLSKMNYISMPVVCLRKEAFIKVGGFNENIPKFKDWNLWIRLSKAGYRFLHIAVPITQVSIQKESISTKFKVEYDTEGHYLPTFFSPVDCPIYATKTIYGEEKPLKVAIFTLTKDRFEYTQKTFEDLKRTAGYPYEHFVIDQESKDETVDWLMGQNLKKLQLNTENTGIAKGWNDAIKLIKKTDNYDIVIKIDNDVEFITQGWLKILIDIFRRDKKMILSPYVEGLKGSPGGTIRQRDSGDSPYIMINDQVLGIVPNLGGICFASPIELYDKFQFKEDSFYTGGKDYMLSQYAKQVGYILCYVEETRIRHRDTTEGQEQRYPEYFKQREIELTTKYEGKNGREVCLV